MSDVRIRMAAPEDARELLLIYDYYVKETAITFEYETPSVEEFEGRIKKVLERFPYIVAEESGVILGYAYASPFHERAAYQWCAEMSIYLDRNVRGRGIGRLLYEELEARLRNMGILNLNACIGYPDREDEHLTFASVRFHERMGYSMVGEFHKCGFKFGKWYNMVWMEKLIGEHRMDPSPILK
jgi:phosphinothricin acetyltransferase